MPKRFVALLSLIALSMALLLPAFADSKSKVVEVAAIDDLAAEIKAQIAKLDGFLESRASHAEARETKSIQQAAGVLACLAQATAEHKNKSEVKIAAPDLRDAAIAVRDSKSMGDAKAGLEKVKVAQGGKASGAKVEHPWNKLCNLHRLMEEVKLRNYQLKRVIRRPKDPQQDSLHATTIAVLAIAAHADTHEVKKESEIPEWQGYAKDLRKSMVEVAAALKKKDTKTAKTLWVASAKVCTDCHAKWNQE